MSEPTKTMPEPTTVKRRRFLRTAGIGAAGLAPTTCRRKCLPRSRTRSRATV
jgi:hypothetical protein